MKQNPKIIVGHNRKICKPTSQFIDLTIKVGMLITTTVIFTITIDISQCVAHVVFVAINARKFVNFSYVSQYSILTCSRVIVGSIWSLCHDKNISVRSNVLLTCLNNERFTLMESVRALLHLNTITNHISPIFVQRINVP